MSGNAQAHGLLRSLCYLALLLLLPFPADALDFDFNSNCKAAYTEIFSLRSERGRQLLAEEKRQHPGNGITILLESYIDVLGIITSDDASLLPALKSGKNNRLDALKKSDQNSPWHRYTQAEVQLHYALAAFQYQEYVSGLMEMRKAYFLLKENMRLYPDFKPNLKSYYTIDALLGVVPEKYAWALGIFGLEGNLQEGMRGLEKLTAEDWGQEAILKDEAAHIYALLLFHLEGEKKKALETLQNANYPLKENLFSYYTVIKIALYAYHNDTALHLLEQLPEGNQYAPLPVLKYYAGLAYLNQLKTREAIAAFGQFLAETKGENLLKSANHKIAWAHLIDGDLAGYKKQIQIVNQTGIAQAEADKQAKKEAGDALLPHLEILKARLLFDGGYFEQSLNVLEGIRQGSLSQKVYELELVYRRARVLHEMQDTVQAIENYKAALTQGRNEPYYYAANAALNLGLIYESKGDKAVSRYYFNACLEMDNHEYQVSLQQKAKAGLTRLKQ